jgi:hypothetical protein
VSERPAAADSGIQLASANHDGSVVAYSLGFDSDGNGFTDRVDLRLVAVDQGDDTSLLVSDTGPPAHLPFEVRVTSCDAVSPPPPEGPAVAVGGVVRQWRGGSRRLILRYEVENATQRAVVGPFVQPMEDEMLANVAAVVPFDGIAETCRVVAIDGAAVQADTVIDAVAFPFP